MNPKLIPLLLALVFVLNSCAHQRTRRFESALKAGRCEDAVENIPENDPNVKFVGRANRAAGTAISYAATGAGYTADVVLVVTGGVLIFAAVCGPMLLAMAASSSTAGVNPAILCLPVDYKSIPMPSLGKDTYKGTEEWRCPDLTALSRSVRRVASCHESSPDVDGKKHALTTLNSLKTNKDFMNCIGKSERDSIMIDVARLEKAKDEKMPGKGIPEKVPGK